MGLTVDIVEDDDAVRDSLRALLESYGYTVHEFPSAEPYLKNEAPTTSDVLIVDHHMPGMTGTRIGGDTARPRRSYSDNSGDRPRRSAIGQTHGPRRDRQAASQAGRRRPARPLDRRNLQTFARAVRRGNLPSASQYGFPLTGKSRLIIVRRCGQSRFIEKATGNTRQLDEHDQQSQTPEGYFDGPRMRAIVSARM